jgi:hypothetical protein
VFENYHVGGQYLIIAGYDNAGVLMAQRWVGISRIEAGEIIRQPGFSFGFRNVRGKIEEFARKRSLDWQFDKADAVIMATALDGGSRIGIDESYDWEYHLSDLMVLKGDSGRFEGAIRLVYRHDKDKGWLKFQLRPFTKCGKRYLCFLKRTGKGEWRALYGSSSVIEVDEFENLIRRSVSCGHLNHIRHLMRGKR